MKLYTEVQQHCEVRQFPGVEHVSLWADAAFSSVATENAEVTIRVVGLKEGAELNRKYRKGMGATNVLSFAYAQDPFAPRKLLGDIVICAPVVHREALAQNKPSNAHWAHMVVHGILHLCGYDHVDETDAQTMEQLETEILFRLGFPAPYN